MSGIFNDSKTFVDMPMNKDPEEVWQIFLLIPNPTENEQALRSFIDDNFDAAGSDIEVWSPEDFNANPAFIDQIKDGDYKKWAFDLNQLWLSLGRRLGEPAVEYPERHSFLRRNYPFIVPGGRCSTNCYRNLFMCI